MEIGDLVIRDIGSYETKRPLKSTPNWDDLGCPGIPREGWGIGRWDRKAKELTAGGASTPTHANPARVGDPGLCHMCMAGIGRSGDGKPQEIAREKRPEVSFRPRVIE